MNIEYIVIQAGGLGTRLKDLTRNKPKGIVSVNNLPLIFHSFRKWPKKKFIIIADYKSNVLKRYLNVFADVNYTCVIAKRKGTCSGIKDSLKLIPKNTSFMIVWSDLIFDKNKFDTARIKGNTIGITNSFSCRWSFNKKIIENPSNKCGIAGAFFFKNKSYLYDIPEEGEFVRYLSTKNIVFDKVLLEGVKEIGTLNVYNEQKQSLCRPFNELIIRNDVIIKKGINSFGKNIGKYEVNWYKYIENKITCVPTILSYKPLIMKKINGNNPFDLKLNLNDKITVVNNIMNCLDDIHSLCKTKYIEDDAYDTYFTKTYSRLNKVKTLIPFSRKKYITINETKCLNPLFAKKIVKNFIKNIINDSKFVLIHGDPTFSNILVDQKFNITLIDPRGYFGNTTLFGDVYYDWAKLYYSLYGDYDQFNKKRFKLFIENNKINFSIETNGFKETEKYFIKRVGEKNYFRIKLIHCLIWLSLVTYVWDDYDSICCAFYNGTLHFNNLLKEYKDGKILSKYIKNN